MNPFKREIKMVNNFKGNKGQIYIRGPLTTTGSLQINHITTPSLNWSTPKTTITQQC
jgi:hypothetical protein